jgi:hypothetical protein
MSDVLSILDDLLTAGARRFVLDEIERECNVRKGQECGSSLYEFIRTFWHVVEPGREFVEGWHLRCLCAHLEAVTEGKTNLVLFSVPPVQ